MKEVEITNKDSVEAIGKLVPVVSLLVAVSGILFTVGFFSAIGIEFITLFSFQEHLVFSLVSVPVLILNWGIIFGLEENALISTNPKRTMIKFSGFVFIVAFVLSIFWQLFVENADFRLVDVSIPVVLFSISLGYILQARLNGARADTMYGIVFYFVAIFAFGNAYANNAMREKNHDYVIDNDIGVAILRFGSDFVLFSADKNRVLFRKTDDIDIVYRDKAIHGKSEFCFNIYSWKRC